MFIVSNAVRTIESGFFSYVTVSPTSFILAAGKRRDLPTRFYFANQIIILITNIEIVIIIKTPLLRFAKHGFATGTINISTFTFASA